MGNKTKLTPELIKNIAAALSNGITRETAARYARVSYQTFYNWRNRGKVEKERRDNGEKPNKKEKLYLDFFNQIDEGETEAIMNWQDTVNKAARTDPVWAFKMLTLRDPKGYFQNQVQYTAEIDLDKLTDEQLIRVANGENPADVIANPSASPVVITPEAKPKPISGEPV